MDDVVRSWRAAACKVHPAQRDPMAARAQPGDKGTLVQPVALEHKVWPGHKETRVSLG